MKIKTIFFVIIIFLGMTAAMLPAKKNDSMVLTEQELLQEMLRANNYLTTDELAEKLILD